MITLKNTRLSFQPLWPAGAPPTPDKFAIQRVNDGYYVSQDDSERYVADVAHAMKYPSRTVAQRWIDGNMLADTHLPARLPTTRHLL